MPTFIIFTNDLYHFSIISPYPLPAQTKKAARWRLFLECKRSTLGELLAAACLMHAHLFPLDFPRIPGNQPRLAEHRFECRVVIDQRSRDAMSNGTGLARFATTIDIDENVESAQVIGQHQRLAHYHSAGLTGEEFV